MTFLEKFFGPPSIEQLETERDTEKLITMMTEKLEVACAAIAALGRLAAPQAVKPLLAVLEGDDVRKTAISALGKIGDARAVESLAALLTNERIEIQTAAARALGQIGDPQAISPLLDAVQAGDISKEAAMAIVQIDANAVERLAPMLHAQDRRVRWAAAAALSEVGAPAVGILIDGLKEGDNEVLAPAAWALGETEDARAVDPLMDLLDHPNEKVRQVAAKELGRLEDKRAVKPLIAALDEAQDEDVREVIVEALEALTGESWEEEST
jgi:HEAT repeat protein